MHEQIVGYIRQHRATYTRDAITAQLLKAGQDAATIEAAWAQVEAESPPATETPPPAPPSPLAAPYRVFDSKGGSQPLQNPPPPGAVPQRTVRVLDSKTGQATYVTARGPATSDPHDTAGKVIVGVAGTVLIILIVAIVVIIVAAIVAVVAIAGICTSLTATPTPIP